MENLKARLLDAIKAHKNVSDNVDRKVIIQDAVDNREVIISESGALATWTPVESTGRSPKDTVFVKRAVSEKNIDWTSPNNLPIDEEIFDMVVLSIGLAPCKDAMALAETMGIELNRPENYNSVSYATNRC